MKLRQGGIFFEHYNHFRFFILVLSLGAIYFIFRIFKIENYDWLYAIPIGLHFLFSPSFNTENDENSESDKS